MEAAPLERIFARPGRVAGDARRGPLSSFFDATSPIVSRRLPFFLRDDDGGSVLAVTRKKSGSSQSTSPADPPADIPVLPASELGFQLRLDGGRAALTLEQKRTDAGEVRRAIFDVTDPLTPAEVAAGALAVQQRPLTLRAVELALPWDVTRLTEALRKREVHLLRERPRAGGIDLLLLVAAKAADLPAPVRARVAIAPMDDGIAFVVDELIGLPDLPRGRLSLAEAILDALDVSGAAPASAMVRLTRPVHEILLRLLAQHGWATPTFPGLVVKDISIARGEVVVRAWTGALPDGWRTAKEQKRAVVAELLALQQLAQGLAAARGEASKRSFVEGLARSGELAAAAVPFVVEVLRGAGSRATPTADLIKKALEDDDEHLGVLSIACDEEGLTALERSARLQRLAAAADGADDPWVAARAGIAAAVVAERGGDLDVAIAAATGAVDADPTLAESGRLLARLLLAKGERARALEVGRAALDRAGHGSIVDSAADLDAADAFSVELAAVARDVEGLAAARVLLLRALRQQERSDALMALAVIEAEAGEHAAADAVIVRLRALVREPSPLAVDVALLSSRIAEMRGDTAALRQGLEEARALAPADARVAVRLAALHEEDGDLDAAIEVFAPVVDAWLGGVADAETQAAAFSATRLLVMRAHRGAAGRPSGGTTKASDDAVKARRVLARILSAKPDDASAIRLDAEARAALGDGKPLAQLLLAEAAGATVPMDAARLKARAASLLAGAGDPGGAVEAWRAAWDLVTKDEARAVVDVAAWLTAARSAADPRLLGELVSRAGIEGLDLASVVTTFLRASVGHVADVDARRALLGALAARNADVEDTERWLQACRDVPPAQAAEAFVQAARAHRRVAWLLEGLDLFRQAAAYERGLGAASEACETVTDWAQDVAVLDRMFTLAIDLGDAEAIDTRADALVKVVDGDARRDVFRRRVAAHNQSKPEGERSAKRRLGLRAFAAAFPADREALDPLVAELLDDGVVDDAVAFLDAACAAGLGADAHLLLSRAVAAARTTGGVVEVRANELLLGMPLQDEVRSRVELRLADLYEREQLDDRAIALLSTFAARKDTEPSLQASLLQRVASLHEKAGRAGEAIGALEQALYATPDDAATSERLRKLASDNHDERSLARECLRRAGRLGPSEERNALWVQAGELAVAAGKAAEARVLWLRAVRRPFSPDAWTRLQGLADQLPSRRLRVRALLAVAKAHVENDPERSLGHVVDAAQTLVDALQRRALAIRALSWAERHAQEKAPADERATRALVVQLRAHGDGKGARARIDTLLSRVTGLESARLLAERAEISATLLGDEGAALADRRTALAIDPTAGDVAAALAAQLRGKKDPRAAFDVERALIEATLRAVDKGEALAKLADAAHAELGDDGADVVDGLCAAALVEVDSLDARRRQLAARERLGNTAPVKASLIELLARDVPGDERLALAMRLAELEEAGGDVDEAAQTLLRVENDSTCAGLAGRDAMLAKLVTLLVAARRTVEAADVVVRAMAQSTTGIATLGPRSALLCRAARWLDEGASERRGDALALLGQAAALNPLDDDDEIRRARLAEEQERPDIAIVALERLIERGIDVAAHAVRLAAASEAWGEPDRALRAWGLRIGQVPDDVAAWLAMERLASSLQDVTALRQARTALVAQTVGSPEEQAQRAVLLARDAQSELEDRAGAVMWMAKARDLASSTSIRRESFERAVAAGNTTEECDILDDMIARGDIVSPDERLRRATLRLAGDATATASEVALADALFVLDSGVQPLPAALATVLATVAPRAIVSVAAALAAKHSAPLHSAFVAAAPQVDTSSIPVEALEAILLQSPEDAVIARLLAVRDDAAGQQEQAADRLLAVADRLAGKDAVLARSLVDDAARYAVAAGAREALSRLDLIRPALRRHPALREAVVEALQGISALAEVADIFEDAIIAVDDDAESRSLRLRLTSVLRNGIATREATVRAAGHLEALFDANAGDVDAADGLISCLEELLEQEKLQALLARHAAAVTGARRRMMIESRVKLLFTLGRASEGLEPLAAARKEAAEANDDDKELKALERKIHVSIDAADGDPAFVTGGPALARFLDDELSRKRNVEDARDLLALPAGAATPGARVRARLALLSMIEGEDDTHARELLEGSGSAGDRADEAVEVLRRCARNAEQELRQRAPTLGLALARRLGVLGSRDALRFVDGIRALDEEERQALGDDVLSALSVPTLVRRWRLTGPRNIAEDLALVTGPAKASLAFRRAARLADRTSLESLSEALGQTVRQTVTAAGPWAAQTLRERAAAALKDCARGVPGDLALVRHGDPRGSQRTLARPGPERHAIARRSRLQPLSPHRLKSRLALATSVAPPVEDAIEELLRLVSAAAARGEGSLETEALDALFALRAPKAEESIRRAELALAVGANDAITWCERAADAATSFTTLDEQASRLRRRAIEAHLRSGNSEALAVQLRAFARSGPSVDILEARRTEALSIAEAARLVDVVDAIMTDAAAGSLSREDRLAALRKRVSLRMAARQPRDAVRMLIQSAARDAELAGELREEAYRLAAREALVEEMAEVVDDDLARAGLLALLGSRQEAMALAATLEGPAPLWLRADCARWSGDVDAEDAALAALVATGLAGQALVERMNAVTASRGQRNERAQRALEWLRSGSDDVEQWPAMTEALVNAASDARREALDVMVSMAQTAIAGGAAHVVLAPLLKAALVVAIAVDGDPSARVAATLEPNSTGSSARRMVLNLIARSTDVDTAWIDVAADDLDASVEQFSATMTSLWHRHAVVVGLLSRADNDARLQVFVGGLSLAVESGAAATIVDALASETRLPTPVAEVVAAALVARGAFATAGDFLARVLRQSIDAPASVRRSLRLRAADLYTRADASGSAARLLQQTPLDEIDDELIRVVSQVIVESAQAGAMGDAASLAAHMGQLTKEDRFWVRAMGMADAAGGNVAIAVGTARLRAGDVRALPLLAHHCLEQSQAQGFFAAWHALRSGLATFAPKAPADFHRIARLRELRAATPPWPELGMSRSLLEQARLNPPARRRMAWATLADEVQGEDVAAKSRLLARAQRADEPTPPSATDGDTSERTMSAASLVDALPRVSPTRRQRLVAEFDALTARGGTTGAQRRSVDQVAERRRPALEVAIDAAAVGEFVDVPELLRTLGRRPDEATRTTAAALLQSLGLPKLTTALAPSLRARGAFLQERLSREAASEQERSSQGTRSVHAQLGRLQLAQLSGPRIDVEEKILALAEQLHRPDIVVRSLHRLACLSPDEKEQAKLLLRRAESLRQAKTRASWASAVAAHRLHPQEASARLLVGLAEQTSDRRAQEAALEALAACAEQEDTRVWALIQCARVVASAQGDPARAAEILGHATQRAPRLSLFEEHARIVREHLRDDVAAADVLIDAAVRSPELEGHARIALLRGVAENLAARPERSAIEKAVAALCRAHDLGDHDALAAAEALARQHGIDAGLGHVLDARLRDIDDVAARRELMLERARMLRESGERAGGLALLEAQALADPVDLGARLALAEWYLADGRNVDAASAFESAARIPGLPLPVVGPPAREAAVLLAAAGNLEQAGPLAALAVDAGVVDADAVGVAEAWHRSRGNWVAVDELLGKQLTQGRDPARDARLWMERAALRRERTSDDAGARKAVAKVLELAPEDVQALQQTRDDALRSDTWGTLRAALLRASEATTNRTSYVAYLREMAAIDADRLGDVRSALALLDRILEVAPEDVDAMAGKALLMVRAGHVDGVSALMEQIESAGGDLQKLPGQLHLVRGDSLVVAGDVAAAQVAFLRAAEDPETSAKAWDRLIDMVGTTGDALPLLEEAQRRNSDPARASRLARKEMRLRSKLGDDDGAFRTAQSLLQNDATDAEALEAVRAPLLRAGRAQDYFQFLVAAARAIPAHSAPRERAARLAHSGTFALWELKNPSQAQALFEEALGVEPSDPESLVRLAELCWAARDVNTAAQLFDRISGEAWLSVVDHNGVRRNVVELLVRRAQCAQALGLADVRERVELILQHDPSHALAWDILVRLPGHEVNDDLESRLETLSRSISRRDEPGRLAGVLATLAEARRRRGKGPEALAAAEGAFDLDPTSVTVLATVAAARTEAGRSVDAADAWGRLAAMRSGTDRYQALEQRAIAFHRAGFVSEAAATWAALFQETGDAGHQAQAEACAAQLGTARMAGVSARAADVALATLRDESGASSESTAKAVLSPLTPGDTVALRLGSLAQNGRFDEVLKVARATNFAVLDAESVRIAIDASERTGQRGVTLELVEARLANARDPAEVRLLAYVGGLAAAALGDFEKAASLLYQAHQVDAEDIEVRFALTSVYARIPRLAPHAVTGVLQLLRRVPDDPRAFALGADVADSMGNAERAFALRSVESVLRGQAPAPPAARVEPTTTNIVPLDRDAINARLAPTGWGGALQQLLGLLGPHLEILLARPVDLSGTRSLVQVHPRASALALRIDRLLPGRAVDFVVAPVVRPTIVVTGSTPTAVLPHTLLTDDIALLAAMARASAVVRWNGTVIESLLEGQGEELVALLRSAILGQGPADARAAALAQAMRDEEKRAARNLMVRVLEDPAVQDTTHLLARGCDRFGLLVTAHPIAAVAAGAVPGLLGEQPFQQAQLLRSSPRALDLVAFAARDNVWQLRRAHGL
jgi:tetratricopeptide (TPR) repeat protein